MGLDKRARAERKAAKLKETRQHRRTEKEWVRNQASTWWTQSYYQNERTKKFSRGREGDFED